MFYSEVQALRKHAAYIPVNVRKLWKALSHEAKNAPAIRVPGRAGDSFSAFAKGVDQRTAETVRQQLEQIGLGDKVQALRYRGPVRESVAAASPRFEWHGKIYDKQVDPFYKPDISIRRVALNDFAMPAQHHVDRSLATPGLALYASAPGGTLGPRLVRTNGPIADIYLTDKYMQRDMKGKPLVDLDVPLSPREQQRQKLGQGVWTKPVRTYRLKTPYANEHALSYGQVIRQGTGKVDDVGGLVFYPNGRSNLGYMFTTSMAPNAFTNSAKGEVYGHQYGKIRQLRKDIDDARTGFLEFMDQTRPYNDKQFMSQVARKPVSSNYNASVNGDTLVIQPKGYQMQRPIELTKADRETWARNYQASRGLLHKPSLLDRLHAAWLMWKQNDEAAKALLDSKRYFYKKKVS